MCSVLFGLTVVLTNSRGLQRHGQDNLFFGEGGAYARVSTGVTYGTP